MYFLNMHRTAMTKEDDYRRNAADAMALARRAGTSGDKGRLLALAEKWLDLAEQAHRRTAYIAGGPVQQGPSAFSTPRKVQPEAD